MLKMPIMQPNLPEKEGLNTEILPKLFSKTTNSYKFYWFLGILKHLKYGGDRQIEFADIIANMIYLSWHTINDFKVSLGVQDKIARAMKPNKKLDKQILQNLNNEEEIKVLFKELYFDGNKNLKHLTRYVPHLFLEPFVAKELNLFKDKKNDNKRREEIKRLAALNFETPHPIMYKFEGKQKILIHPKWQEYFLKNMRVIEDFTYWNLVQYLQSRNPNVPNISQKISPPDPKRGSLSKARKIWRIILENQVYHCIYSNQRITVDDEFVLDHFIPWSFVAHDMIWNLIPTSQTVNSSKSNNLPALEVYFSDFSKIQYNTFHELLGLKNKEVLEVGCTIKP